MTKTVIALAAAAATILTGCGGTSDSHGGASDSNLLRQAVVDGVDTLTYDENVAMCRYIVFDTPDAPLGEIEMERYAAEAGMAIAPTNYALADVWDSCSSGSMPDAVRAMQRDR